MSGSCGSGGPAGPGGPGGSCGSKPEDCGQKPEDVQLERRLSRIRHKIVVLSGKGGVGKSTVAVNLAVALAKAGLRTGLLDIDLHGPSAPRLLSLRGERITAPSGELEPINWRKNLDVVSTGLLMPEGEALIWRGALKIGVIRQFVADVAWGDKDVLVVDCPPGTGDEPLTALQTLGADALALVVTTPQAVAVDDVKRSITFCRQLGNPILGVVENMSGYVCTGCGQAQEIFRSADGGGRAMAEAAGVAFLGAIPLDGEMVRAGDEGYVLADVTSESPSAVAFMAVADKVLAALKALDAAAAAAVTPKNELKQMD